MYCNLFTLKPLKVAPFYTSEDLKWDAHSERHFKTLLISGH